MWFVQCLDEYNNIVYRCDRIKCSETTTNGNKSKHKGVKYKIHNIHIQKSNQAGSKAASTIVLKFRLNQPICITMGITLCIYKHAFMLNKLVNRHTRSFYHILCRIPIEKHLYNVRCTYYTLHILGLAYHVLNEAINRKFR